MIQIFAELRHCDRKSIKTKQNNFSPRSLSLAKTDPPRSHSSGLDSVLVSSFTFCLPYDFTIDYALRDQPLPSLRANTKSATPLQRPYTQDEVSNAVRRKPRTDKKYTTFRTRIHHLPRMGLNHRYLDQRRRHRWTHRLVLGSGEFSIPAFLITKSRSFILTYNRMAVLVEYSRPGLPGGSADVATSPTLR